MFGISLAPEKDQSQVISQVLKDCEMVQNISDDIVVFGRSKDDHDGRLRKELEKLKRNNLSKVSTRAENYYRCIIKIGKHR